MSQTYARVFERVIPSLMMLRDEALQLEQSFAEELAKIEPAYRASARNLLHYLGVRRHDIRNLQRDLASLGLSSLGVLEAHVLTSLNAVLEVLGQLTQRDLGATPDAPVDFRTGPLLLRDHTRTLLGSEPGNRQVRIMVTMPSEAATNPQLVRDLLTAGMDIMRINCAHDDPKAWRAMVDNLRRAEREVGRSCRVQADLGGPKLRTGSLKAAGRLLKIRPKRDYLARVLAPALVWLTPASAPKPAPTGARSAMPVDAAFLEAAQPDDEIHLLDGRERHRHLKIVSRQGDSCLAETEQVIYALDQTQIELMRDQTLITQGVIGPLPEVVQPLVLFPNDTLLLTRDPEPGQDAERDENGAIITPARIHCTLEAAFESVRPGEHVWLDDGKIGGLVKANNGKTITIKITYTGPNGGRLRSEKGINFPDTEFQMSALTDKDIDDLAEVVDLVDMVALSFLRGPEDITLLQDHLYRLEAVLKNNLFNYTYLATVNLSIAI